MQEKITDFVTFNGVNVLAVTFSMADVEAVMSVLVLVSAFAYNIKKLTNDGKKD